MLNVEGAILREAMASSTAASLATLAAKAADVAARVEARAAAARDGDGAAWANGDEDAAFFVLKQEMLTAYCGCLSYYMLRKARGESVKDHPVLQRLFELRLVFEKLRLLEPKLRHQLDKVLSRADDDATALRPDGAALAAPAAAADAGGDGLYRAPRHAAVGYGAGRRGAGGDSDGDSDGDDSDDGAPAGPAAARGERAPRNTRARRAEIAHMIRSGGDQPELVGSSGVGAAALGTGAKAAKRDKRRRELRDQEKFEEDRMVRVDTNKKLKKKRKTGALTSSLDDLF